MYMAWKGFCEAPKTDAKDEKGDGKDAICGKLAKEMAPVIRVARAKKLPKDVLHENCLGYKNASKSDLDGMNFCYPDVVNKFKTLCKGDNYKAPEKDADIESHGFPYSDGEGGTLFGRTYVNVAQGSAKRPGLLLFPGPYGDGGGKYEREVARKYARKGFAVFVVDYFPTINSEDNQTEVIGALGAYPDFLVNTSKAQRIARLGYEAALTAGTGIVDPDNLVAMGFCFGGSMVLNLARSGAKLALGVSLHGEYPELNVSVGSNGATGKYNTKHFVEMVGLRDPFIPEVARKAWVAELTRYTNGTNNTFDFITYPNATHAFSIKYSQTFLNVLAFYIRTHQKQNVSVVGHNIPGVIEYDPAISAKSFKTIDGLIMKMGIFNKSKADKGDGKPANPICASMATAMKPAVEFTKMAPFVKTLPKESLDAFCAPMTQQSADGLKILNLCYPDVMKKVKMMCSGWKPSTGDKKPGSGDKKPANFTYDVGLVYTDKECKVKADAQNWVGEFRLTKPVGVCTTNVIGSSVIFKCDKGVIQEHVYIDASQGSAPKEADCSGTVKYVMPIENGCNNYAWGSMYMAWKGFCEAPKTDDKGDDKGDGKGDDKGDGKGDDKPSNPICVAASERMKAFAGLKKEQAMKMSKTERASLCGPLKTLPATAMNIVKGCYPEMMKLAMEVCKGDDKGDDKGKSGAGGLRIRSSQATIEMGGDVKLFRSGAKALTVDAAVNVKGSVSAKSVKIGGVPLDEYIRQKVRELLEKEK